MQKQLAPGQAASVEKNVVTAARFVERAFAGLPEPFPCLDRRCRASVRFVDKKPPLFWFGVIGEGRIARGPLRLRRVSRAAHPSHHRS